MGDGLPLSVGLARAITSLSWSHDSSTGVRGSLALWADGLQHLDGAADVSVKELPARTCLSKRAVTTVTKRLKRIGFVEEASDRAALRLTPVGAEVREAWRPVEDDAGLRSRLVPVVSGLELEHPHFPIQYGTADPSMTGGPGQDWKPVPRVSSDGVASLSLIALLSQTFTALAMAYEQKNGALGWVANVCAFVPDEGVPLATLPADATRHLSGMNRHGWIEVVGKDVRPTPLGRHLRDAHQATLAAVAEPLDPDGSLAAAVAAFVASRPVEHGLDGVFHPPTHLAFGMK